MIYANNAAAAAVRTLIARPRTGSGAPAANGEGAATATGKNLPVALPDAGETAKADSGSEKPRSEGETETLAVAINDPLAGLPPIAHAAGHAAAAPRGKAPALDAALPAAPNMPAPVAAKTAAPATDGSQAPSSTPIAITARLEPAAATPADDTVEAAPLATPKGPRAADPIRPETPAGPLPPTTTSVPQHEQSAAQALPGMSAAPLSAPSPAPADMIAALDHLAAAREAATPAEAVLAIDHAEFGEISIRFEQSREGRLSVELAAADPDLQRAVNAAAATERSLSPGADGDPGRPAGQNAQRGSAAGNDAAQGDGAHPRHDRDTSSRRGPVRHQAAQGAANNSAGVFA